MGRYLIRVATGAWTFSGSHNRVQLWLVGVLGEAELELQLRPTRGQVRRGSRNPDPGRGWARGGRVVEWGQVPRDRAGWNFRSGNAGRGSKPGPGVGVGWGSSARFYFPRPWSSQPPLLPQPQASVIMGSKGKLVGEPAVRAQLEDRCKWWYSVLH